MNKKTYGIVAAISNIYSSTHSIRLIYTVQTLYNKHRITLMFGSFGREKMKSILIC